MSQDKVQRQDSSGPTQAGKHRAHQTPPTSDIDAQQALALLEAVGEGVCIVDHSGTFIWSNGLVDAMPPAVRARLSAACAAEIERRRRAGVVDAAIVSKLELVENADPLAVARSNGDASAAGTTKPLPADAKPAGLAAVAHQRTYEVVLASGSQITGADAHSARIAAVVRDVTRERSFQAKLAAIDQAGRELLQIDAETVRSKNALERLRVIEARIVRSARELLRFDHFAIRMIDRQSKRMDVVISYGLPASAQELEVFASESGSGLAGVVAATGQAVICDDALLDRRFLALTEGARSGLVVPLAISGEVIGVLDVESLKPHAFTTEDLRFAEIFARSIAMAFHLLNILIVERSSTNQSITDRVQGEVRGPLDDIVQAIAQLRADGSKLPGMDNPTLSGPLNALLERIGRDVESVQSKITACAAGPSTVLGIDRETAGLREDPVIRGRRILVADDAEPVRRLVRDVLHNRGGRVVVCHSGSHAIDTLQSLASSGDAVDLVLSDISMRTPDGQPDRNGYEVFAAARRVYASVPVILMTGFGYDPHHSIVRASQEGLAATLFKPFQVERLVAEVRKALGAKPDAPASQERGPEPPVTG